MRPRPSAYGCLRSPCLSVSQFPCPLTEERGTPGAVPAAPFLEHLQAGSQRGQGVGSLIFPRIDTARAVAPEQALVHWCDLLRPGQGWYRHQGHGRVTLPRMDPWLVVLEEGPATGLRGLTSAGCGEASGKVGPDEPIQQASAI
ncbi:hypothetical protein NDU88_003559 [Pleurodeles waltl]|uniref:Uncharacterized protein n=1 Tax=Pleurodeles waltl TaxID=8319 RepID=A0AAV7WS03_PLEWA|nr:hypothetical protein NDU88_003559 [Pleurodeles waltl]